MTIVYIKRKQQQINLNINCVIVLVEELTWKAQIYTHKLTLTILKFSYKPSLVYIMCCLKKRACYFAYIYSISQKYLGNNYLNFFKLKLSVRSFLFYHFYSKFFNLNLNLYIASFS